MLRCALVPILAAALLPVAASATVTTATYSGKIGYGFDTTGVFGTPGSLNEVDYVMVYTVDDAAPGAVSSATATSSGITGSGAFSPVRLAITVNGVTRTIDGSLEGTAQRRDEIHASGQPYYGLSDYVRHVSNAYSYVVGGLYHSYQAETYISSYAQDFAASPDYRAPLDYPDTTGSDSIYNLVQFNDYDFGTNTQIAYAYLNMRIGELHVRTAPSVGGVPEPASWALLIAGFGLTGAVARRRRAFAAVSS